MIKDELKSSLLEIEHEDNVEMEMVRYMEEPQEVITIIRDMEKFSKSKIRRLLASWESKNSVEMI